jgi:hypothetical protein
MESMMAYDQACFDLAEYFLHDEPDLRGKTAELAQSIQNEVENWIGYELQQLRKKEG